MLNPKTIEYIIRIVQTQPSNATTSPESAAAGKNCNVIIYTVLIEVAQEDTYHMTMKTLRAAILELLEIYSGGTGPGSGSAGAQASTHHVALRDMKAMQVAVVSIALGDTSGGVNDDEREEEEDTKLYASISHTGLSSSLQSTCDISDHCFVPGEDLNTALQTDCNLWLSLSEENQTLHSLQDTTAEEEEVEAWQRSWSRASDTAYMTAVSLSAISGALGNHNDAGAGALIPSRPRTNTAGSDTTGTTKQPRQQPSKTIAIFLLPDRLRPDPRIFFDFERVRKASDASGHSYSVYEICLTQQSLQWYIEKRYSQFVELHAALKAQAKAGTDSDRLPYDKLPVLTGKRRWKGWMDPAKVESERKQRLGEYLQQLLDLCNLSTSAAANTGSSTANMTSQAATASNLKSAAKSSKTSKTTVTGASSSSDISRKPNYIVLSFLGVMQERSAIRRTGTGTGTGTGKGKGSVSGGGGSAGVTDRNPTHISTNGSGVSGGSSVIDSSVDLSSPTGITSPVFFFETTGGTISASPDASGGDKRNGGNYAATPPDLNINNGSSSKTNKSNKDQRQGRGSIHINMLANMAQVGDLVLFRCNSASAVLQRVATGAEFDHTGIVVHRPLKSKMYPQSTVYAESGEKPTKDEGKGKNKRKEGKSTGTGTGTTSAPFTPTSPSASASVKTSRGSLGYRNASPDAVTVAKLGKLIANVQARKAKNSDNGNSAKKEGVLGGGYGTYVTPEGARDSSSSRADRLAAYNNQLEIIYAVAEKEKNVTPKELGQEQGQEKEMKQEKEQEQEQEQEQREDEILMKDVLTPAPPAPTVEGNVESDVEGDEDDDDDDDGIWRTVNTPAPPQKGTSLRSPMPPTPATSTHASHINGEPDSAVLLTPFVVRTALCNDVTADTAAATAASASADAGDGASPSKSPCSTAAFNKLQKQQSNAKVLAQSPVKHLSAEMTPNAPSTPSFSNGNANTPNKPDHSYIAKQFYQQDLYILEASSAGITILPLVNRLKAYEMYKCCDYICLRRLKANKILVPPTQVLTNRTPITTTGTSAGTCKGSMASAATADGNITPLQQSSTSAAAAESNQINRNLTQRVDKMVMSNNIDNYTNRNELDYSFADYFDPFTIYRLNSFLVTVQRAPYGFQLSSMLFASKRKSGVKPAANATSSNGSKSSSKGKDNITKGNHKMKEKMKDEDQVRETMQGNPLSEDYCGSSNALKGESVASTKTNAASASANTRNTREEVKSDSAGDVTSGLGLVRDSLSANFRGSFRLTEAGWSTYGSDDEPDVRGNSFEGGVDSDKQGGTAGKVGQLLESHNELCEDLSSSPHPSVDMGTGDHADAGAGMSAEMDAGVDNEHAGSGDRRVSTDAYAVEAAETLRSESVCKDACITPTPTPVFHAAVIADELSSPVEPVPYVEPEAEVQVQNRTFFCSALTAAALQVLHVVPASYNDNYFWPGSFSSGGLVDHILKQNTAVVMNSIISAGTAGNSGTFHPSTPIGADTAAGTAYSPSHSNASASFASQPPPTYMYTYSYGPEITIDCHVPEIADARILQRSNHLHQQRGSHAPSATVVTARTTGSGGLKGSTGRLPTNESCAELEAAEALQRPAATFTPTLF